MDGHLDIGLVVEGVAVLLLFLYSTVLCLLLADHDTMYPAQGDNATAAPAPAVAPAAAPGVTGRLMQGGLEGVGDRGQAQAPPAAAAQRPTGRVGPFNITFERLSEDKGPRMAKPRGWGERQARSGRPSVRPQQLDADRQSYVGQRRVPNTTSTYERTKPPACRYRSTDPSLIQRCLPLAPRHPYFRPPAQPTRASRLRAPSEHVRRPPVVQPTTVSANTRYSTEKAPRKYSAKGNNAAPAPAPGPSPAPAPAPASTAAPAAAPGVTGRLMKGGLEGVRDRGEVASPVYPTLPPPPTPIGTGFSVGKTPTPETDALSLLHPPTQKPRWILPSVYTGRWEPSRNPPDPVAISPSAPFASTPAPTLPKAGLFSIGKEPTQRQKTESLLRQSLGRGSWVTPFMYVPSDCGGQRSF